MATQLDGGGRVRPRPTPPFHSQPKEFCLTQPAAPFASDIALQSGPPFTGNLRQIATGEWTGWYQWAGIDPFEEATGPFYVARDSSGIGNASGIITGFRPGPNNCNGHGMIHGGALMTFADFSLFMLGSSQGDEVNGVTVTMNSEFLAPAQAGQLLIGRGERTGGGRSLIIARGMITANDHPVLHFSGVIKQFKKGA
jgi:acyl-coenzyme A thioesterase PaaI-like protein